LKDDNTIRKSMLKLVRMVQKLKNDNNRDDSLLFQTAQLCYGKSSVRLSVSLSRWRTLIM